MLAKKKFSFQNLIPSDFSFLLNALIVGIGTGIGAVLFRYLIKGVEWVGYTWIPSLIDSPFKWYVIAVPAVGGLIVGPMIYLFAREAKGHGVPEVMEAVALKGGRIRPVVAVVKSLASSISIGSGGSVGREGPIVQIGSAIGSTLGQKMNLSDTRIRNLVACGAAAGIAATFNAPIAGVLFALEIILGEFTVRHFSSVVVSAVSASVIGQAVFGDIPAFVIPYEYGINNLWEFALYPILGILAALWGVTFVRTLYWSEDVFTKWKLVPEWLQPMIGGILLGIIALLYPLLTGITWDKTPQIFNVGYEVIEKSLANELVVGVALALLVLKLIATSLTLGSGGSGGVFAPSLFMGAMLGTAFDLAIKILFPEIIAPPGAYALLGMAAVFAATAHAPITAVLILFELTGDYRIILPLMLTVVISTILAQAILRGESIYTLKLSRRGVRLRRGRDIDIMEGVLVQEVMSRKFNMVSVDDTLKTFSDILQRTHSHSAVILDDDGLLWGIITVGDLDKAIDKNMDLETSKVIEAATPIEKTSIAYPDETIGQALNKMYPRGIGRLPVVSRDNHCELLGLVRRQSIIRAYHLGLTRRTEISQKKEDLHIQEKDGTEIIQLLVPEAAPLSGKHIKEIASLLPENSLLVSIRREEKIIIPRGDTSLFPGDYVSILTHSNEIENIFNVFYGTKASEK